MRTSCTFILTILAGIGTLQGQDYSLYSNDTLAIQSEYLQETIELNLHVPETQPFSDNLTTYPIIIIFDSQHERTYPVIISSIDLLTSETQIPESIVVGVPFNFRNRLYLTSSQKRENDSISGIERMKLFLFNELIPELQNNYKGSDYISIIGHSRTGFLVNYLAFEKPSQINLAVSLSGFFNNDPLSVEMFSKFLTDKTKFPRKFNYYYTSGTSLEESNYLTQFRNLDSLLKKETVPKNVEIVYTENKNANHITNYWVSVPPILIDVFSDYNSILDSWFYDEFKTDNIDNAVQQFEADLEQASLSIGTELNPNLTHIFSLASLYANDKKDYKTAVEFFAMGLRYFPNYLDFYVEIIEYSKALNDTKNVEYYKSILHEKVIESTQLNNVEKAELMKYLGKE